MPLRIVFMGTPKFSVPTLEVLFKNKFEILCVYTQPPSKYSQRDTLLKILAVCKKYPSSNTDEKKNETISKIFV